MNYRHAYRAGKLADALKIGCGSKSGSVAKNVAKCYCWIPVVVGDDAFEWDDGKAAVNFGKHGVTFDHARQAFSDTLAVGEFDDRFAYGEDRYTLVGMVQGTLIYVAYTERDDRIRIIMARRATRDEQDDYCEQNGGD